MNFEEKRLLKSSIHRLSRAVVIPILIVTYAAAATYPYRFLPPEWRSNAAELNNGVAKFPAAGILLTPSAPVWLEEIKIARWLRFNVAFRSLTADQAGPARILTISSNHYNRNLTLAQEGRSVVLRVRHEGSDLNGTPAMRLDNVIVPGSVQGTVIEIRPGYIRLEVDDQHTGMHVGEAPLTTWYSGFRLALGNELTWERPWLGEIFAADLESDVVSRDLLRDEGLQAPHGGWIGVRVLVIGDLSDVVLNFVGFIPIGLITAISLGRRRRLAATLIIWGVVCGSVEIAQLLFASRYASPADVVLNLAGAAAGVLAVERWTTRN